MSFNENLIFTGVVHFIAEIIEEIQCAKDSCSEVDPPDFQLLIATVGVVAAWWDEIQVAGDEYVLLAETLEESHAFFDVIHSGIGAIVELTGPVFCGECGKLRADKFDFDVTWALWINHRMVHVVSQFCTWFENVNYTIIVAK